MLNSTISHDCKNAHQLGIGLGVGLGIGLPLLGVLLFLLLHWIIRVRRVAQNYQRSTNGVLHLNTFKRGSKGGPGTQTVLQATEDRTSELPAIAI
jgi:hypothetical protein